MVVRLSFFFFFLALSLLLCWVNNSNYLIPSLLYSTQS
uniref:Uncharacterized protein n=1 Tax=Phakopsora pachyrhizi TaxID=170000 RepID=A0A0S1MKG2_PHAPC